MFTVHAFAFASTCSLSLSLLSLSASSSSLCFFISHTHTHTLCVSAGVLIHHSERARFVLKSVPSAQPKQRAFFLAEKKNPDGLPVPTDFAPAPQVAICPTPALINTVPTPHAHGARKKRPRAPSPRAHDPLHTSAHRDDRATAASAFEQPGCRGGASVQVWKVHRGCGGGEGAPPTRRR